MPGRMSDWLLEREQLVMHIGGLQKSSMIDYPGQVACVLFLAGCNFHCPYCHNPSLACGRCVEEISTHSFFEFLEKRRDFLDAVVISGGEPTLNDGLPDLCRRIRHLGFSVKLDTNGSRPQMLGRLLAAGCLDYVAMDLKTTFDRYGRLCAEDDVSERVAESIKIILSAAVAHEFRTTCVRPFVDREAIEYISKHIGRAQRYFLQRFVPARLLDPTFCRDGGCLFSEGELLEMKKAAAVHVGHCGLR